MKSMNDFQIKIFKEISQSNTNKNIMISPLSIYHILSLTVNGASKNTLTEMLNTLSHNNINEMNKDNKKISSCIGTIVSSIEMANGAFIRINPEQSFLKMIQGYKAQIELLKDVNQINAWCSKATHNKITKIIESTENDDIMVLINAIYFKGFWEKTFDKKNTEKDDFTNYNNLRVKIDFMNQKEKFDYLENDYMRAISLNYKRDNFFFLKACIFLPKKDEDINIFIKNLTIEKYREIVCNMKFEKVNLFLPKFEINFQSELKPIFESLGMKEAFTNNADFTKINKCGVIKIGNIIHKTFIKVDEEGTEASAVTATFGYYTGILQEEKIFYMKVNRPFLFIIRTDDLPMGHDILFISKIESL